MNTIHPALAAVTERITERSSAPRAAYLQQTREAEGRGPARGRLACANLAAQFPRLPRQHTNPAGCYDRHRTAPPGAVWQPARRAELSRTLTGPLSVEDVLSGVIAAAVELIPAAAEVAVLLINQNPKVETHAATSQHIHRLHVLRERFCNGSAPQAALYGAPIVCTHDLRAERR